MDFGLLGPLTVDGEEAATRLTAGKPRQALALLLLSPGRVVSTRTLVRELWGDRPPASTATSLQTYVLHLRRLLAGATPGGSACGAKDLLVTRAPGYLMRIDATALDTHRFEARAEAGRARLAAGDDAGGSELLRRALATWRGPALVDVPTGELLDAHVRRLEEGRLLALEQRIEADLRIGREQQLLGELTALVTEHPTHEQLHAQFMLALHRCGRRTQALTVYMRLRNTLVDRLGLEPSPALQRLQQAILSADPQLDGMSPLSRMVPAGPRGGRSAVDTRPA